MSDALSDLLARVEAATGPDYQLGDTLLELARSPVLSDEEIDSLLRRGESVMSGVLAWNLGNPTASLDAALALAERCLPGWLYHIGINEHGEFACELDPPGEGERHFAWFRPTAPLAVLAALLKALIAERGAE